MTAGKRVVVVGAGVIGLATAWALRRKGAEVVVVEMGEIGKGASHGNAGWVVPSLSEPLPSPGLTSQSLRMMLRPDSPFHIRPSALPGMVPWLLKFRSHCNARDYEAGFRATAELNKTTVSLFDDLVESGVRFEMHKTGLLYVSLSQQRFDHLASDFAFLESLGYPPVQRLTGDETRDLEPVLSGAVSGGFLTAIDRSVRPDSLVQGLADWLREAGVEIRTNEPVTNVTRTSGLVDTLNTSKGNLTADAYVLAAGAWSAALSGEFGVRLPIQSGTGYSITIPQPRVQPAYPLDLAEARVACTPFDGLLRFAGTMELAGLHPKPNPKRVQAIKKAVAPFFADWRDDQLGEEWMGMRPLTPDGLPVIGRAPKVGNVFVATGHSMLGVTLAPVTGSAIADLIMDGSTGLPIEAFSPARFSR